MITLPKNASLAQLQAYIQQLEHQKGWLDADCARNCFLMGEEVGELFGAVRALERIEPHASERPAAVAHVGEELVDVLNYLLAIANRLNISLEEAFREKNHVNQRREWS